MSIKKGLLFTALAALIACYFVFDLGQYFSLDYIKQQQSAFDALYPVSYTHLTLPTSDLV